MAAPPKSRANKAPIPVLIAGGGPVGLALAVELGLRGVECLLVEQTDGVIDNPKMQQVNARTMEFCRRWGIADSVRNAGWPDDFPWSVRYLTSMAGHEIARHEMPSQRDMTDFPYGPEARQRCPQFWFDPILRAKAAALPGVTVRLNCRLDSFRQAGGLIEANLTDGETGSGETVTARILAACDGGSSPIREASGIALEGPRRINHNLNIFFRAPDLLPADSKDHAVMNILLDAGGQWGVLVAIDGKSFWRIDAYADGPIDLATADPGACIRRAAGRDIDYELVSVGTWTRRRAVAERYRDGNVFLVGDAAHQLSPNGGFGMNTGIGDAVDLAWKLAATFDGWGSDRLLDSYEAERRPIAVRNVEEASRNYGQLLTIPHGAAIAEESAAGSAQRQAARDFIAANDLERQTETSGIALGYFYEGSPIVWPDGTPPPADDAKSFVQTARPGHRAPHAWLTEGRSTLDLFGSGFVLLRFGNDPGTALIDAASACGLPLETADIADAAIADLYGSPLVLVRPDGHVAWRGTSDPDDAPAIIDRIRGA